jgi:hypothetical protein
MAWLRALSIPANALKKADWLARLSRDCAGNTLAIVAAALLPLLAMIGGGIDMARSYLAETRLQQACDAGTLAARKALGSSVVATGTPPSDVAARGNQLFNLNFQSNAYGTRNVAFTMTLEPDYSISGVATVEVPTTIMAIFGFSEIDVRANCQAQLNFKNTDVMMVLDTTGSMNDTNPGDTDPKITVLKNVVTNFYNQLEGSKGPDTRIRFGFVPYSVNANVGSLLQDDWVVSNWTYQSRKVDHTQQIPYTNGFDSKDLRRNVSPCLKRGELGLVLLRWQYSEQYLYKYGYGSFDNNPAMGWPPRWYRDDRSPSAMGERELLLDKPQRNHLRGVGRILFKSHSNL